MIPIFVILVLLINVICYNKIINDKQKILDRALRLVEDYRAEIIRLQNLLKKDSDYLYPINKDNTPI